MMRTGGIRYQEFAWNASNTSNIYGRTFKARSVGKRPADDEKSDKE